MDYGEYVAEQAFRRIKRSLKFVFALAIGDGIKRLSEAVEPFVEEDKRMRKKVTVGSIAKTAYMTWFFSRVLRDRRVQAGVIGLIDIMIHANESALATINEEMPGVFAENANYMNFVAEHYLLLGRWDLYDVGAVNNLRKNNPLLLPPKKLDPTKERKWSRTQIRNVIVQAITKGKRIEEITEDLAKTLGSRNEVQMLRAARTAMTSAQNAGRMEALQQQADDGIRVQKLWIATLDDRTRDAHQDLDGEKADVDQPFVVTVKGKREEIQFPGDPAAAPALVYNCRCTLGYWYPDFPDENPMRRDNITKEVIEYVTYKEWKKRRENGL